MSVFENIQPLYLKHLDKFRSDDFEGHMEPSENQTIYTAESMGVRLQVLMHKDSDVVARASHMGVQTENAKAIFDCLCSLMQNLTIRECSDHGVIRLEYLLKGQTHERPVPGIVMHTNSAPIFQLVADLTRELFKNYLDKTGTELDSDNFFDAGVSAEWAAKSLEEKTKEIKGYLSDRKYMQNKFEFIGIEDDTKIYLQYPSDLDSFELARNLLHLETDLRNNLEQSLMVYVAELADANRLRIVRPKAADANLD